MSDQHSTVSASANSRSKTKSGASVSPANADLTKNSSQSVVSKANPSVVTKAVSANPSVVAKVAVSNASVVAKATIPNPSVVAKTTTPSGASFVGKPVNPSVVVKSSPSVVAKPVNVNPVKSVSKIKSDDLPQPKAQKNKPKLTDYRCFNLPNIKQVYVKLLNDNLQHLINYIYNNTDKEPYNSAEIRTALSMQMILASNQLIPYQLSSLIAKDLDEMRKNDSYTDQWASSSKKRKVLAKEMDFLKKHTEIDDTVSLNLADNKDEKNPDADLENFDINSSMSSLNVSAKCPVEDGIIPDQANGCSLM